uniref:Uncharacterized protein n=1 Tax=Kalanchoe fedtschenkoi TaxID=63787 RepID=A0A7N0RHS0_KALFE
MAFGKLGSKSEPFHRDGQTWTCTSGLPSDVTVEIGEMSFHLHKFPLLSRSGLLEKLIEELSNEDGYCILQLHDLPGGAKAFELIAKFCYGAKIEITAQNVVSLRCAAECLQMNEDYGEANVIAQTENYLNEVFGNWADSIKVLETCEEVLPQAEELHLVSRCINSLAMKACADTELFGWPMSGQNSSQTPDGTVIWNGITTTVKPHPMSSDWWYEDVSFLSLPLYKRLIQAVESRGMKPDRIAGSLMFYLKRFLPLMNRQSSFNDASHQPVSTPSEADQRALLEEIVELMPLQKGVTSTKYLLRLLRAAMILQASPPCRENLERRVGFQVDQASLVDLLIPNMGYSVETLYDIDCVQRILDHFLSSQQISAASSPCIVEEGHETDIHSSLTAMTVVANLMDSYLSEVAPDVNFKFPKFQSIAAAMPDYARQQDDGLYHAIDIYLKAHPWLTDVEREHLCRLMNCQKLSLEASTHAARNERLPLRVVVQVLFFEQLRLRTTIAGWFFVSDNLENGNRDLNNSAAGKGHHRKEQEAGEEMEERVLDLEKQCRSIKEEIQKLMKSKRGWSIFPKKFGCSLSKSKGSKSCHEKVTPPSQPVPAKDTHPHGQVEAH